MVTKVLRATQTHIGFINQTIKNSDISRHINDDNTIKMVFDIQDPKHFLIVEEFNVPCGLFLIIPSNTTTVDVHTCIRDTKHKIRAGNLGIELLKSEGVKCITSHIPEYNHAALKFSLACGFQKCGFIPQSYLFNGALIGQHLVYKFLGE